MARLIILYVSSVNAILLLRLNFLFLFVTVFTVASVLWDLSHPHIDNLYRAWRKGIRRALGLPADASKKPLSGLCGTLPILDELLWRRSTTSIQRCLSSDCAIVNSITKMSVFTRCMSSPIGLNAFLCCTRFGLTLDVIYYITSSFMFKYVGSHTDLIVYLRWFRFYMNWLALCTISLNFRPHILIPWMSGVWLTILWGHYRFCII